jgi:hypothetical protein
MDAIDEVTQQEVQVVLVEFGSSPLLLLCGGFSNHSQGKEPPINWHCIRSSQILIPLIKYMM